MPPNLTNPRRRWHWAALHGQKQKYYSVCDLRQKVGLLPPPPKKPFTHATVSSVMKLGHAMDDDNALARHKWVLDWLKTRGYVVDDKKKNLAWTGLPEQQVGRKQEYAIEITLTSEAA
jgi:hypothetical protein